jgi:hypothetical protein
MQQTDLLAMALSQTCYRSLQIGNPEGLIRDAGVLNPTLIRVLLNQGSELLLQLIVALQAVLIDLVETILHGLDAGAQMIVQVGQAVSQGFQQRQFAGAGDSGVS